MIALLLALSASAGDVSPFALSPVADGAALAGLSGAALGATLLLDRVPPRCTTTCDIERVPGFDRPVIGNASATARMASNYTNFGLLALPYAVAIGNQVVSRPADGWGGTAIDLVVVTETALASVSAYSFAAAAARRPRPLVYDPATPPEVLEEPGSHISFFSGHACNAFAMAVVASRLYALRHPDSPAVNVLWAGSLLVATATAWMRTAAGKHFYTDVLTGAVVGSAVAFVVTEVHRTKAPRVSMAPRPGGAQVSVAWDL